MTYVLSGSASSDSKYLGGMWAAIATIYVFRDTHEKSLSAGVARFIATCVSFLLCLLYLCIFPPSPVGMVVLIGVGTLVMISLGRRDDIFTTGITTAVVMVVAIMDDHATWTIPILRLLDTVVGIAIGVCAKWIGAGLYYGCVKKSIQ
ncbi:MAG TPA: FUSC family protein [Acidocella sp.]|nr:FUSC family protein [Acidocella sp.]